MVIFNSYVNVYQRVPINGLGLSHQESISGHRAAEVWILKVHEKTAPALHWLCANESLHRYNDQRLLQFVH